MFSKLGDSAVSVPATKCYPAATVIIIIIIDLTFPQRSTNARTLRESERPIPTSSNLRPQRQNRANLLRWPSNPTAAPRLLTPSNRNPTGSNRIPCRSTAAKNSQRHCCCGRCCDAWLVFSVVLWKGRMLVSKSRWQVVGNEGGDPISVDFECQSSVYVDHKTQCSHHP